ncbi:MAG: flagellar basal body P-ring formation chaperone FlgA [Thermodesulfobacteriota bacterium]
MRKLLPVLIFAAFVLLSANSAFCRKIIINLPDTAVVESNKKVRLCDISDINIKSESDFPGSIVVADEIAPDDRSYLYKRRLENILKKKGLKDFTLVMENRIELKGEFFEFEEKDASEAIQQFLENNEKSDFKIEKITLVGNRKFSVKDFDFIEVGFLKDSPEAGFNKGELNLYHEGKEYSVKFITRLEKSVKMVCASGDLPKGKIITPSDLDIKKVLLQKKKTDYFSDKNFLIGKKLRTNYQEGEIIASSMIFKPSLIERGDDVQIIALSSAFSVVTDGEAMAKGHLGDIITVLNKRSGKKVRGEIISSNGVKVGF